jgi:hypothetical protein
VYSFRFGVSPGRLPTILTMPARRLIAGTGRGGRGSRREEKIADQKLGKKGTMFDAPVTLALFAAFLLGIVAGSGLEILVRAKRY